MERVVFVHSARSFILLAIARALPRSAFRIDPTGYPPGPSRFRMVPYLDRAPGMCAALGPDMGGIYCKKS